VTEVRWARSEDGHVDSKCGRFSIFPLYCGRVAPQFYKVRDRETGREATRDRQGDCKQWAHDEVHNEVRQEEK